MSALREAFASPTLVAYLVGGHPDADACVEHASALIEGGAGVLELGVPHSDPIADGPTIQTATTQALDAGVRPCDVIAVAARIHERHPEVPIVLMTYANIPYRMGFEAFAGAAADAGVAGLILPDVPLDELAFVGDALDPLELVLLAAPSSDDERIRRIAEATRGFLYLVGLYGVTGARGELAQETLDVTRRVAPIARDAGVPMAVGFGVSQPAHARAIVDAGANGVVVGSAFVQRILDGSPPAELGALAGSISVALDDGRPDER